jgi:chemotaxis protein methyltransferase CheR
MCTLDRAVFDRFRQIVYSASGISLNEKKEALVSARVAKRMRALGISDHGAYLAHVEDDTSGEEIVLLLDAISTNLTHFFRENHHFEILRTQMEQWIAQGQRRFRFWSAGCSTGEEPYSIAMTVSESTTGGGFDTRILATDLSTRVLHKCLEGVYEEKRVKDVPPMLRQKYFEKSGTGQNATFRVKEILRKTILFKRLNLSVVPYPMQGPMDAIFCRNVMIYFDNEVRRILLQEFFRLLKPGGYLFVGHAESLTGILSGFRSVMPSVYIKP